MNYDIFISFKYSDSNGNQTIDYKIAKNLYNKLSSLGYNVFFANTSLEKIGSSRYKADIDKALDTSKVMIVVLTKVEYAFSKWIQYEWDSFYNDYLSGVKKDAHLFTLTQNININNLPRTLRNVQNFSVSNDEICNVNFDFKQMCSYLANIFVQETCYNNNVPIKNERFQVLIGKQVGDEDIKQALQIDKMIYDETFYYSFETCKEWHDINPDIYVMIKDKIKNKIIAYTNICPISDECYERIKNQQQIETEITSDMILTYDMPFPYSVYFFSVVIAPNYQNTEVFNKLLNAIIEQFILLGKRDVYVKRMIADAVTTNGKKFCKLFGMNKIDDSNHNSSIYEVSMIPPKFRILSKKTKELYDYYQKKYQEAPYLFD